MSKTKSESITVEAADTVKQKAAMTEKKSAAKNVASDTVTVMQVGSPQRRDSRQREYLKSLGLGKMNRVRTLEDSPSIRGLITKLQHMVKVV